MCIQVSLSVGQLLIHDALGCILGRQVEGLHVLVILLLAENLLHRLLMAILDCFPSLTSYRGILNFFPNKT